MAGSKRIFAFKGRRVVLPFRSTQLFTKFVEGMENDIKDGIKRKTFPNRSLYVDGSVIHSILPDQLLAVYQDLGSLNFDGVVSDHYTERIIITLIDGDVIPIPVLGDLRRKNHVKEIHRLMENHNPIGCDPFYRILQDNTNYAVLNIGSLKDEILAITTHGVIE